MNTYKNKLFVSDGDLWRCDVLRKDIDPKHAQRDELKMGYWITANTRTATWLVLKGCVLVNPLTFSDTLGTSLLGRR